MKLSRVKATVASLNILISAEVRLHLCRLQGLLETLRGIKDIQLLQLQTRAS